MRAGKTIVPAVWLWGVAVLCLSQSCVPLSDYSISSAPCPCPSGYRCCKGKCLKASLSCDERDTSQGTDSSVPETELVPTDGDSGSSESDSPLKDTGDTASDTIDTESDAKDTTSETTDTASDSTADTGSDTIDTASDTTDTASDTIDTASDSTDTATDTMDTATDTIDTGSDTIDTASETVDTATDTNLPSTDTGDTSSGTEPCESNQDCEGGEVCLSWRDLDGVHRGPQVCRNSCFSSDECEAWEVCELSLSDGRPISERHMALACLDASGFDDCAPSSCRECVGALVDQGTDFQEEAPVQAAICSDSEEMVGCFIAFDATCGLYCETEVLALCDEGCSIVDGNATCLTMVDGNLSDAWCADMSCDACESDIGGTSCVESQKQACMSVGLTESICGGDCACDTICVSETVGECK